MKKMHLLLILLILLLLVTIPLLTISKSSNSTNVSEMVSAASTPTTTSPTVIARNLTIPWSIAFLPDNSIIFTERPGRVRMITSTGALLETPLVTIRSVKATGEGGLLGLALHPKFNTNNYVYLYYTYSSNGKDTLNKVSRFTLTNRLLSNEKEIVSKIPGNVNHNGGRLKFGPDGFLYITTGDSQNPSLSQDTSSLAGKILRVTDEGAPATGNPFNNQVYSYGHRNPQGLAWDDQGRLWSTEHGPSTKDEVNLIVRGANYGWPTITGNASAYGMNTPIINSSSATWAPSGMVYYDKSILFTGLRGSSLYKYSYGSTGSSALKTYLSGTYGRLRDIILGHDGYFYLLTSNMDGRSLTHLDGDKIIKIHPTNLK